MEEICEYDYLRCCQNAQICANNHFCLLMVCFYKNTATPEKAEKSGKLDFVHTRVKFNKREAAYDIFHSRNYRLPGFYQEVSGLSPTNAADWTKEDKDRFRSAVFEHHENMKEVSKAIGKPIQECITYYLVKFKRTKSYKSLKRSMRRKANVTEGSEGILVCNGCNKGGMLIACDTCEAHFHLGCANPPLESIPDGAWACGNCKRETRSMLSSQDEMSCGTNQNPAEGPEGAAVKGAGDEPMDKLVSESGTEGSGDDKERRLESDEAETNGLGNGLKRKIIDAEAGSSQEETEFSPVHRNGTSSDKRIRMDDSTATKEVATVSAVPV